MSEVKQLLKGNAGLLFAAVGGAVLGNMIPTPGDALAFYLKRKLRDKWTNGEISAQQYWSRDALYYYTLNSSWWILVGLATFYTPGDVNKKLRTLLALTGAGVVFSVLYKNIKEDEKQMLPQKNAFKKKLMESTDPKHFEEFIEEFEIKQQNEKNIKKISKA